MREKIIHLIQKTEQTIDHLKFWLSPMPTSEGFMDSLQYDMVKREWAWYKCDFPMFSYFLKKHYLPGIKMLMFKTPPIFQMLNPNYVAPYWETTKIDVKRTIARMSRNGGIW